MLQLLWMDNRGKLKKSSRYHL